MAGDVVLMAAQYGGGQFDTDAVLRWLADIVRSLKNEENVLCGKIGAFSVSENAGTIEINPLTKQPMNYSARKVLAFTASDAFAAILDRDIVTEETLKTFDSDHPIESCFGRALVTVLVTESKATIGNFGSWSVGQKPNMSRFVRFRPSPAINQML